MPILLIATLAAVIAAISTLLLHCRDCWFFGLLSLAVLLEAAMQAYEEQHATATGMLAAAAVFAVTATVRALHSGRAGSRRGEP